MFHSGKCFLSFVLSQLKVFLLVSWEKSPIGFYLLQFILLLSSRCDHDHNSLVRKVPERDSFMERLGMLVVSLRVFMT